MGKADLTTGPIANGTGWQFQVTVKKYHSGLYSYNGEPCEDMFEVVRLFIQHMTHLRRRRRK